MKTANDFNKHLEKFTSGMSAGNILQAACSTKKRIGECTYTQICISDTAIKVTLLQAGAFVNMDALEVNTTFHRYNKNNEEACM